MHTLDVLDGKLAVQPSINHEYLRQSCIRCPLASVRKNIVWGAGNRNATIMVFDSKAGPEEDDQGLPFVGAWGELLEKIWGEVGIKRSDLFLTLETRCRPLGDRDPTQPEIEACSPYLTREILEVRPQIVVCLDSKAHEPLVHREYTGTLYPPVKPYRVTGYGPDVCFALVTALHPKVWLGMAPGPDRDLVFQHMMSDWQMVARMAKTQLEVV